MTRIVRSLSAVRTEVWLFVFAVGAGAISMWVFYAEGLLVATGDQAAHLNLSRLAIDSLTPGITQVGFMWRPLLHIVLIPFVASDMLYRTGAAAPLLMVPCLGVSTSVLYIILRRLGGSWTWSVAGALLFLVQPYVLYFSVVPMTEVLFILLLFLTALCFSLWQEMEKPSYALICGFLSSLAFLARVEGIILFPLTGLFMVVCLLRRRTPILQSLALLLLFSIVSFIGISVTMIYGTFFSIGPLAFLNPSQLITTVFAVPQSRVAIKLADVLVLILHGMWYVYGRGLLTVALVGAPLAFAYRKFLSRALPLLLLLSPLVFLAVAIFQRRASLAVPELPAIGYENYGKKSEFLLDVRYTLTCIGFIVAVPTLIASDLVTSMRERGRTIVAAVLSVSLLIALFAASGGHIAYLVQSDFRWITEDRAYAGKPGDGVYLPGEFLREHYDFGLVLAPHQNNDRTFIISGIPLKNFVHESNYRYFQQAINEPWLFVRWVVVTVDGGGRTNPDVLRAVSLPEFGIYYTLVYERNSTKIYKINETFLRRSAAKLGVRLLALPSLNPELDTWSPTEFYQNIKERDAR